MRATYCPRARDTPSLSRKDRPRCIPSPKMRIRESLKRDAIAADSSVEPSSSSSSSNSVNDCASIERKASSSVRAPLRHGSSTDTRGTFIPGALLIDVSKAHPIIWNQVTRIPARGLEPLPWRHDALPGAPTQPSPPPTHGAVGNDVAVTRGHEPEIFMRLVWTMNVDNRGRHIQFQVFASPGGIVRKNEAFRSRQIIHNILQAAMIVVDWT